MLEKFKDMGKALKDASKMKDMMKKVQEELKNTVIPVSAMNGLIKIEITGELEIILFEIDPSLLAPEKKEVVESAVAEAFSKAIKQAKDVATNKLQAVTGGLFNQ
jgi:DNA-binding YbaB/EbfC family protein